MRTGVRTSFVRALPGARKPPDRKPPSREPVRLRPLGRVLWTGAEAVVTLGLVLLLLVAHQLWWTNREARHEARQTVRSLEREWGGRERGGQAETRSPAPAPVGAVAPATPSAPVEPPAAPARDLPADSRPGPDRAYAVLRLPSLGVAAPVAEGISKRGVLDKGYVGHYAGTAQPGQAGNFALAGHRNTHGEPFRYLNRLRPGNKLVVETRDAVFTYLVDRTLPQTSAQDGAVIAPVPRSDVRTKYGYEERGYYITLTTCTPEFTSRYRLVVWGKLASMRPR
ncbi:class E sortase [Streptomyces sp. TLI_146]|uniref:class E sortase n=1 Tax=Streptomyces sp. TLI_146 TaxID=1938858 RepID=UPI000CB64F08|nr:class E sortase [Streptomyces sp. TLI_146]PKV85929.1 sortase A [Streptomyces sp. TLI_146]